MLQSEGWQIFMDHVRQAWGPDAFETAIDRVLAETPPDQELAVTSRMRDTFKGVRADLRWPEERVRVLTDGTSKGMDPFAKFRRRA